MAIAIDGAILTGESLCITDWHSYSKMFSATMIIEGVLNEFETYADSSGMQVKVKSGEAFIYGHRMYSAAEVTLPITAADPANPRIDTVVLRRSLTANTRVLDVVDGVAAAIPAPTALTQTLDIYEFALGYVYVAAAAANLAADTVTRTGNIGSNGFKPAIRENVIINGNMDIWQRGTSFAAIVSGAYGADRWRYLRAGISQFTLSQSTDVPTEAQSGIKSNYSLKLDCTTIDAAMGASDFVRLRYAVEGYDYAPLKDNTITISFWVKSTKTGIYCLSLQNNVPDRSYVVEYTINSASTWEKKTATITLDQAGGTEDYTNGAGLYVAFILGAGTNFNTTPNAWQTGNYFSTTNQVNFADNTANDFYLAQVKLELGSGATQFVARPYADELELCKRYFERKKPGIARIAMGAGFGLSTIVGYFEIDFTEKRTAPTVTFSAQTDFETVRQGGTFNATTSISGTAGPKSSTIQTGHGGVVHAVGEGLLLVSANTSAYIDLASEL